MNEQELISYCREHAGEDLPAECRDYLESHPDLRKEVDRLVLVAGLVSLKRYETPDPAAETRMSAAIRSAIRKTSSAPWWIRLFDRSESPAFGLGFAAACLALAGLGVVLVMTPANPPSLVEKALESPQAVEAQVAEHSETQATNDLDPALPVTVMQVASNTHPVRSGDIQYGTGLTIPVRYDYE